MRLECIRMRVGKNALYPADFLYGSPSKPLWGREIHSIEQSVGDAVLFLCGSLASLLCSLRGVMNRGSSSSGGVL